MNLKYVWNNLTWQKKYLKGVGHFPWLSNKVFALYSRKQWSYV